jgi:sigma-B regulation protein RsbU (phosphoserine phosphatase)
MPGAPIPLLVVDDNEQFAALLLSLLDALAPDLPVAPRWVDTAGKAREELARQAYDLVLLDNKLPGADGLDLLVEIAQLPADRQPAVIMLTATGNETIAVQAIKRGAKDYLSKLDLELPALTRAISGALERRRLEQEIRAKNAQLAADLQLAREVQEAFLPQSYPAFPRHHTPATSALQFTHRYLPTAEVGGDFFDVFALSDTEAGLLVCDVMGHGLRAALVTAILRGLVEELMPLAREPGRFLAEINRGLHTVLRQTRHPLFTSACYAVADIGRAELRYANAGHPPPIHVRRRIGQVAPLPLPSAGAGAALGLLPDATYPSHTTGLAAEDLIIFYTDGLFEVPGAAGEQFGEERLRTAIHRHHHHPADELFARLIAEIQQFSPTGQFADDVCLLGVEVRAIMPAVA